jgi:murein L,D-transpeptidase YcbB/YkuD
MGAIAGPVALTEKVPPILGTRSDMAWRLTGIVSPRAWLVGALLVGAAAIAWPAAAESEPPAGFVEVRVEPPAPIVIAPAPEGTTRNSNPGTRHAEERSDSASPGRQDRGASFETPAEPAAQGDGIGSLRSGLVEPAPAATAEAISLPDLPAVVVQVPPAKARPEPSAVRSAERPADPAVELAGAIGRRLADASLALPPKLAARDREALAAAYAAGGYRPLWIADRAWNPAGASLIDRLARAGEDGLDPTDYPAPRLEGASAGPDELAEAELKLSAAAFLYARDARGGRLEPSRLGALITPKLDLPGVERVLATLAGSNDPGGALQGFNPRYPGYEALREKLAEARAHRPMAGVRPPRGGAVLASASPEAGLGIRWTPRLEGDLLANMERWRWLPAQVGERYLQVNVPEFRLRLVENGDVVHEARVITGATATPTPVFSDMMDHAIVNPSWFVPPSILKKMNVEAAARQGYHVTHRRGVTSVRMPPGPRNALGYIKFMFPNDHAVYLHDTPNRGLFANASRALSHGCVRVQDPFALAGKILGPQWSESRLKGLIGYGERMIKLEERLPIHLSYFTLYVDEHGELKSFGDIYGYHRRVRVALGLGA